MRLLELARHTLEQDEQLWAGEADPFDSGALDVAWGGHDRKLALADEDGRLVASVGLVVAPVQAGACTFDVVGFGGMIVTAARRGEGLARRVLTAAIERAAELGPDFGLLFCRADRTGLYARLGFARLDGPVRVAQPGGPIVMPLLTMWRPLRAGAAWPVGPVALPVLPF
jgi:GNAT superfamily N-acetyltransferase